MKIERHFHSIKSRLRLASIANKRVDYEVHLGSATNLPAYYHSATRHRIAAMQYAPDATEERHLCHAELLPFLDTARCNTVCFLVPCGRHRTLLSTTHSKYTVVLKQKDQSQIRYQIYTLQLGSIFPRL